MLNSTYQHTIKKPVTIEGIGVHSGEKATLKIKPAPEAHGIVFVRTDVEGKDNIISAKWNNVVDTRLCTVLGNAAGVTVSTVEHLLSAFATIGLDNAIVKIDGPEVPIMDGSSIHFIKALTKTGLKEQEMKRKAILVKKAVSFFDGDKEVFLTPSPVQRFSCEIDFDSKAIGQQNHLVTMCPDEYRHEIAPARTFGMLHEVEHLRKMGLTKGGSLQNAIVVDEEKVLNPEGLRYENEFVRHKILDAIGDLYLSGMHIIGHYHGLKASHALNNRILHELFSQPDAFEIIDFIPKKTGKSKIYSKQPVAVAIPAVA